jgi:hypothetical protein
LRFGENGGHISHWGVTKTIAFKAKAAAIKAMPPSLGASLIIQYYPSVVVTATLGTTTTVIGAAATVKLSLNDQICRNGGSHGGSGVWHAQI